MSNYFIDREKENRLKLKSILLDLPIFAIDFFTGIEGTTSILTRLNYAYDLRIFFSYLKSEVPYFANLKMKMLSPSCLDKISVSELERFLSYVSVYENLSDKTFMNGERGKSRKLACVRSFYKYYFNKGQIQANIASKVAMPKIHNKEIIRLEIDEVVKILNEAENGLNLSTRQQAYHQKTAFRDLAILTLFLGTGIRISELVGLNLNDVNFENNSFTVTRKGGNRTILYFSEEVSRALRNYIKIRQQQIDDNEDKVKDISPLFLSLQLSRMSVRAIQLLVKKYSAIASPLKKISPHKLRTTYGTELYRQTQDIYVVADVLGHKDVNTTKKHYAAISDEIRRNAASKVQLREDNDDNK